LTPDPGLAARLHGLHPPPAPPWWPPAPGWWLVIAAAALVLVLAARAAPGWWRRLRRRRRLIAALEACADAAEVSQLLRAAALERFAQHEPAGLHGAAWIDFLEARDAKRGRFAGLAGALTEAPYRPAPGDAANQVARLRAAARGWLRAVL